MLTAAFALAMTIMCVSAQPPQDNRGPRGPMTAEQMVQRLDQQLKLSDEQKAKLTEVYTKQFDDMKKMFESGERPEPEEMKAIFEKNEAAVKAVLNDEQKAKYDEMRKNRQGGPGGPGGPRPEGPGPEGPRPE